MRAPRSLAPLLLTALSAACATLGTQTTGGDNLPTSDIGPFRKLGATEVLGVAPYVLDGLSIAPYEEPSVLPLDASDASMNVALYADATVNVNGKKHGAIVRTRAVDGVSFYGTSLDDPHVPKRVLDESEAWEEGAVHSPSVLRVGASIYMYYAAGGGIGLAVSSDGFTFTKNQTPVLVRDPSVTWETTAPTQPSVAIFPDKTWHMLYAAGTSIGEATSSDGYAWKRVGGAPVLTPSPPASLAEIDAGEAPFDTGQVADPCLLPRMDDAGKLQVRVLYTGYAGAPGSGSASAIGFAARYGDSGPLERSGTPVYAVGKHEAGPALFEWSEGALLYVHEDSSIKPPYPAIAAAVFPVTRKLPHPGGYAASP